MPVCWLVRRAHVAVEFQRYGRRLGSGGRGTRGIRGRSRGFRQTGIRRFRTLRDRGLGRLGRRSLAEVEDTSMHPFHIYLLQLREHIEAQRRIDRGRVRWGFTALAFRRRPEFALGGTRIASTERKADPAAQRYRELCLPRPRYRSARSMAYSLNRRRKRS